MLTSSLYKRDSFAIVLIILFSFGLFYQVFQADYLYLDEAYAIWNNRHNYMPYAAEGRLITGILFIKLFSVVDTIAEMKYFRIISFFGWIVSAISLYYAAKNWTAKLRLSLYFPLLLAIFCICSTAVSIYVGWASCSEVCLAFLPALAGSQLVFSTLMNPGNSTVAKGLKILAAILLAVISLMIYQSAFGVFILPLLLIWITKDVPGKNKKVLTGIIIYLLGYLAYYLAFKMSLAWYDLHPSGRAGISIDPLHKIGFFVSALTQGWNLNLLLNLHSFISQVIPVLLFVTWLYLFVRQSAPDKAGTIVLKILGILILLALAYLPPLVIQENFSSYRTMLALSLCSFSLLILSVLKALRSDKKLAIFIPAFMVFLVIAGYLNFNRNYINPLKKEYRSISGLPVWNTIKKDDTLVFIRPAAKSFSNLYGVKGHKDEFGIPSTFRDWVPENLSRQLILEKQSMEVAQGVTIFQLADVAAYADSLKGKLSEPVLIDMNEVLRK